MDEKIERLLKEAIGMSSEDMQILEKSSPGVMKFLAKIGKISKLKIVAEIVYSKYCFAQVKEGQKLVFRGGILDCNESTAPFCARLIGPITSFVNIILDRVAQGVDPNDSVFRNGECLDPGLSNGGLGKVKFKVYVEGG